MQHKAMQQFITGLKSRHADTRAKAAHDLSVYVNSELREATPDEITKFLDPFYHEIFEMVSSSDVNEKKGGILAIGEFTFKSNINNNNVRIVCLCSMLDRS